MGWVWHDNGCEIDRKGVSSGGCDTGGWVGVDMIRLFLCRSYL